MLDHVNRTRACHILAIENPTEFVHEPLRAQVTHREVGVHVPTIAAGLRCAHRENPDVVFVSELTSAEEIELALGLADDGVFVLSTFPASGVAATLERLVDAFAPESQARVRRRLSESLGGIVIQHLLRGSDGRGRVAVHEILVSTPAIASLVADGKTAALAGAMKAGSAQGMQALDAALERLLGAGKITAEAALERAIDKEVFARVVARTRPDLVDALG